MNRREILKQAAGCFAVLLAGFAPRSAKASPEAIRLAKNGIISPKRTPWMMGGKVFVDGKEVTHVRLVNVTKGYVVRYRGATPRRSVADLQTERVYGYIHAELKEGEQVYEWGRWPDSEVESVTYTDTDSNEREWTPNA